MELVLQRDYIGRTCTIGSLFADGIFECFTLEDLPAGPEGKIPGKTRIPAGRYQLVITHSQKFGVMMPLLIRVPNYSGIRIHAGNNAEDTNGCVLVGALMNDDGESLLQSRIAYSRLFSVLSETLNSGEQVWIDVRDEIGEDDA